MKQRLIRILAVTTCAAMLLSGCSLRSVLNRFTGGKHDITDVVVTSSEQTADEAKTVDESLEAPVFSADLTGSLTLIQGETFYLETEATVSDGGEVTYQWYRNNVNANGGGTPIGGATDTAIEVDTTETQSVYYYAVATNNHGESVNMSVSGVFEINVIPEGAWEQDETGFRYVLEDGTNPADTTIIVAGMIYVINAEGYRTDDGQPAPERLSSAYVAPGAVTEQAPAEQPADAAAAPAEQPADAAAAPAEQAADAAAAPAEQPADAAAAPAETPAE